MKATNIVHWPGRDVVACDRHTAQLISLAAVMGFLLSVTPLCAPSDVECTNCENERVRRPAFAQLCSD